MRKAFLTLFFLIALAQAIDISECQLISQPGTYVLTSDLQGAPTSVVGPYPGKSCITIASKNVVLDCKGHKIEGPGPEGFGFGKNTNTRAIYVSSLGSSTAGDDANVEIKNCEISSYSMGIHVGYSHGVTILNNHFSNVFAGVFLDGSTRNELRDNVAEDSNRFAYVNFQSSNNVFVGNVGRNLGTGFRFNDRSNNNIIEDNIMCRNVQTGYSFSSNSQGNRGSGNKGTLSDQDSNTDFETDESCMFDIDACTVIKESGDYVLSTDISGAIPWSGEQKACIIIDANDVQLDCQGNSISYYGTDPLVSGIVVTNGKSNIKIQNCRVSGSTEEGIGVYVSSDVELLNNVIENTLKQGIDASADNLLVSGNTIKNTGTAISYAGTGSTFSNNDISDVSYGIILTGANIYKGSSINIFQNNKISATEVGIYLIGVEDDKPSSNKIEENTIDGAKEGIRLELSTSNTIEKNDLVGNEVGIAFYSSTSNQINFNTACLSSENGANPSFYFDASSSSNRGVENTGSVLDEGDNPNFQTVACKFSCVGSELEVLPQDYLPVRVVAEDPNGNLLKLTAFLFDTDGKQVATREISSPEPVQKIVLEHTFENLPLGGYVLNATAEDEAGKVGKAADLLYYLAGSPCPSDEELEQLCKKLYPSATYDPETGECNNPDSTACFTFDVARCDYGIYFVDPTPRAGYVVPPGEITVKAVVYDRVSPIIQASLSYVGLEGEESQVFYPQGEEETLETTFKLEKEAVYLITASFVDEAGNTAKEERMFFISSSEEEVPTATLTVNYDVLCPSGSYLFTIADQEGNPVEGASVSALTSQNTITETTNEEGKTTLSLQPQTYDLFVSAKGFQPYKDELEVPPLEERCPETVAGEGDESAGHELSISFIEPTPKEPFVPSTIVVKAQATDTLGDLSRMTLKVEDSEGNVVFVKEEFTSGREATISEELELKAGAYIATATAEDSLGLVDSVATELIADPNAGQEDLPSLATEIGLDCETDFATITVLSEEGPVEGASVFINDGSETRLYKTSSDGSVQVQLSKESNYYVRVWKEGFQQDITEFSPLEECTKQFLESLELLYSLLCNLNAEQDIETTASLYTDSLTEVLAQVLSPTEQTFTGTISREKKLNFPVDVSGEYVASLTLEQTSVDKSLFLRTCNDAAAFCIQQTLDEVCSNDPQDTFCSYLQNNDCLNSDNPFLCSLQGYVDECSGSDVEKDSCSAFKQCLEENGIIIEDQVDILAELREREPSIEDAIFQSPQICAALILLALGAGFWFYKKYYA